MSLTFDFEYAKNSAERFMIICDEVIAVDFESCLTLNVLSQNIENLIGEKVEFVAGNNEKNAHILKDVINNNDFSKVENASDFGKAFSYLFMISACRYFLRNTENKALIPCIEKLLFSISAATSFNNLQIHNLLIYCQDKTKEIKSLPLNSNAFGTSLYFICIENDFSFPAINSNNAILVYTDEEKAKMVCDANSAEKLAYIEFDTNRFLNLYKNGKFRIAEKIQVDRGFPSYFCIDSADFFGFDSLNDDEIFISKIIRYRQNKSKATISSVNACSTDRAFIARMLTDYYKAENGDEIYLNAWFTRLEDYVDNFYKEVKIENTPFLDIDSLLRNISKNAANVASKTYFTRKQTPKENKKNPTKEENAIVEEIKEDKPKIQQPNLPNQKIPRESKEAVNAHKKRKYACFALLAFVLFPVVFLMTININENLNIIVASLLFLFIGISFKVSCVVEREMNADWDYFPEPFFKGIGKKLLLLKFLDWCGIAMVVSFVVSMNFFFVGEKNTIMSDIGVFIYLFSIISFIAWIVALIRKVKNM